MKLSEKPMANPAVVHHKAIDGDVVLVNLDNAASLALNPTGFLVWQLVDGERTVKQIVAAVHQRFPTAPPESRDDVEKVMEILAHDGFIGFQWTSNSINKKKDSPP